MLAFRLAVVLSISGTAGQLRCLVLVIKYTAGFSLGGCAKTHIRGHIGIHLTEGL